MPKNKDTIFFNRELSWVEFNGRVLHEACRKEVPLLERLKFLSIVTSNFDEFFMVRVAGLKQRAETEPDWKDISNLTPKEQLTRISARVHKLVDIQYNCLNTDILPALENNGLVYVPSKNFTSEQKLFLEGIFQEEIFPLLTPLRTDNDEELPHINNLRLFIAFTLKPIIDISTLHAAFRHKAQQIPLAFVQIPTKMKRIIWLPSPENKHLFTLVDDIITYFGTQLFPGYSVEESMLFRVTRDADFAVNEDAGNNFIQAMEEVLVQRQSSLPVRLVCNKSSDTIRNILQEKLHLEKEDVYEIDGILELSSLEELWNTEGYAHLKYPQWKHFYSADFDPKEPMWDKIKQKDVLLYVPFESYEPVINFLNSASEDPGVLAIKMTLYRTSGDSPIIRAIERAARNGKQVTVFVELKARFDEKRNISWASRLQKAGVIVVHGIANLKVHAKLLLVVRREANGVCRYVHLSTGNYNEKTARLYCDMSLFTVNQEIANDATMFFNMISGYSIIQVMKQLYMAPINLKNQLVHLIEREIQHATPETPGLIMAKMNSLAHEEIIQALYKASNNNVHILLNVRGICMLVPGVKKQSENISVISIIDEYLEHSRIFYFQNGGAEEIYLSSADWMPRNLDRRVELMFPVAQEDIFKKIKDILILYFSDNTKSHYLDSTGTWIPRVPQENEEVLRAQEYIYNNFKRIHDAHIKETPTEFVVRRNDAF